MQKYVRACVYVCTCESACVLVCKYENVCLCVCVHVACVMCMCIVVCVFYIHERLLFETVLKPSFNTEGNSQIT